MTRHCFIAGAFLFFSILSSKAKETVPVGTLPVGANGQALNLDFETGDLRDWLVNGEAFKGQPIQGDTVKPRRPGMRSQHQGKFWIGGYEKLKDTPIGTLTSASFKVTHPWAAFLVGGGPHQLQTCVEIVQKDNQKVIFRVPGRESENMQRAIVDLQKYQGKEIFIRVVDTHTGHWGHVNFDDFRFYKAKPKFPNAVGPKRIVDLYEHKGLPADKAAEVMTLPEGFKVIAAGTEPDVKQPIAMAFDDRGRLWVAEAYSYPIKLPKKFKAKDRILIFEDTNGDGKLDNRKVFIEGLNLVSGIEVGFGGVWVGQAPELLFIPDRDGDDKPDGKPEVVLDGWGYHDTHETLNSFIWGPDGWLYGCHGVFTHSRVGKPETPNKERTPINAGIWRYHPIKKKFEVFAWGTSNPWGVDFNDHGQCFLTCCVIPHLFHVIQGAKYQRQAGSHFNPHVYADIPTIAVHRHWVGNQWNNADRAKSDALGGGHAHAGAMIYLGDSWPAKYRNQLFMNNIHGARLNQDQLTPKGSGYVGNAAPDFCKTNDLWSQILYLRYGPDGQVTMIDWYDGNQCHHRENEKHDRSNGRIYKIVYKDAKPVKVDLTKKTDAELVKLQLHANDWYVRHARRLLMERAHAGTLKADTTEALDMIAFDHADVTRRLRGLWALHVIGQLTEDRLLKGLRDKNEYMRAWSIQLACENGLPSDALMTRLEAMAKHDASPKVRLYLASALQRFPLDKRFNILKGLMSHTEDAKDHNLPLMYWYALEPTVIPHILDASNTFTEKRIPILLRFFARRVASANDTKLLSLLLEGMLSDSAAHQLLVLQGVQDGLQGRRKVEMPKSWSTVFTKHGDAKSEALRSTVWALAVKFGDPSVKQRMRTLLAKDSTPIEQRRQFLASLLSSADKELPTILHQLVKNEQLRSAALRGLASYEDGKTPKVILEQYEKFSSAEKRDALVTLVSRAEYAKALLTAIGEKKVSSKDLTADLVRQLRNLRNKSIDEQINKVWGTVRQTAADKLKTIAKLKAMIKARPVPQSMRSLGRAVFAKTCSQCHTLFGVGGNVGPDLTGSNRADLDYLLSNVIDPSAVLGNDYVASVFETSKGRVITGLIKEKNKESIKVITLNETLIIPRNEIEEIYSSKKSMMPEDLLTQHSEREIRALVAYLASPGQVPMKATPKNASTLFNGKDFTGWTGDARYWKVENGEIIGTRPANGKNKNEFLISDLEVDDFRLSMKVKLTPNSGNSGVQFRSERLPGGDVRGYQADIGVGWWGKLYEEHGRGLLVKKSGEEHVKVGEWNEYQIEAVGNRIRTWINGQLCVDITDPPGRRSGILALQVHSGAPFTVRFKDLKLKVIDSNK